MPNVPNTPNVLELRVRDVIAETADACSLVFDASPEQVPYRPGQFLTIELPGGAARSYSLASSPHTDPQLKVTIKRVVDGYGSNWLCDKIQPGDTIRVLAPSGVFTPRGFHNDLLLMAAGSGITPVISIAKSALAHERSVLLFYANRDERSVIFHRELAELAKLHPDRFTVLHWLETVQDLPTKSVVSSVLAPYKNHEAFVCGPAGFMATAREVCERLGMPGSLVHFEKFVSLAGDPFAQPGPVVTATGGDDAGSLLAEIDGDVLEAPWPRDARMLDALISAGADAPFSCREGSCGACACRVIEGEVAQPDTDVLDPADIAQGWVLACQATRLSDSVKVSYEE